MYGDEADFGEQITQAWIETTMGKPKLAAEDIPLSVSALSPIIDLPLDLPDGTTVRVSCVNTGSTHTVIWVDALPDDATFLHLSPLIEHHPFFSERTSVLWAAVAVSEPEPEFGLPHGEEVISLRIWERGVGETLACGTGACAVALMAFLQNKIACDRYINEWAITAVILSKGGRLRVDWYKDTDEHLALTGTSEIVYSGEI